MAGSECESVREELMAFALSFPEAWVDYPWEFPVVKVRKKIFAFLEHRDAGCASLTLKLPESGDAILLERWAEPMSHGLGRSGWVTMWFEQAGDVPLDLLFELIEESYAAVAPKKLVAAAFSGDGE